MSRASKFEWYDKCNKTTLLTQEANFNLINIGKNKKPSVNIHFVLMMDILSTLSTLRIRGHLKWWS